MNDIVVNVKIILIHVNIQKNVLSEGAPPLPNKLTDKEIAN